MIRWHVKIQNCQYTKKTGFNRYGKNKLNVWKYLLTVPFPPVLTEPAIFINFSRFIWVKAKKEKNKFHPRQLGT